MKQIKELSNKNKIIIDHTSESNHKQSTTSVTLKFVFNGFEDCEIKKRKFSIYPDSFAFLNKEVEFTSSIYATTPVMSMSLLFEQHFLEDFHHTFFNTNDDLIDQKKEYTTFSFPNALYHSSDQLKFNILNLRKQLTNDVLDEMLLNEYLNSCMENYYEIYDREFTQKLNRLSFTKKSTKEEVLKRLGLAKEYISSNFNRKLTLEAIANHCCLSVNHLLKTFKEAYGLSPYQYLVDFRLKRAKYLLENSNYTLKEIVNLVGFECPSSFIRLFKYKFIHTPITYKVNNLNLMLNE